MAKEMLFRRISAIFYILYSIFLVLPSVASAQAQNIPPTVLQFVGNVSTQILNPLIALMFALAMGIFIWGVLQYIWSPDNEEARSKGQKSMFWGVIGMLIMVSVFGIVRFIITSIGADPALLNYV